MAKINADRLAGKLTPLAPVYLVAGGEPLQLLETNDAIRAAARAQGFDERERWHSDDSHFQWEQLIVAAQSIGLFSSKKIVELHCTKAKLTDAAAGVIQEYCLLKPKDVVLVISMPKLEKRITQSAWYKAVDAVGVIISVWPIDEKRLPTWLGQRLRQRGLKATPQAIALLSAKAEGNLLAAAQEIDKLALSIGQGEIDETLVANAVADSARFNVFSLIDRALLGLCEEALRTLEGLRQEGTEAPIILWALARELRMLETLQRASAAGKSLQQVARSFGVFDKRMPVVTKAIRRIPDKRTAQLLQLCALADRCIKGQASHDVWQVLQIIVLELAGQPVYDNACETLLTEHAINY